MLKGGRFQCAVYDRDRAIADRLGAMIRGGGGVACERSEKDPAGP
ncbi:hypothetical protein [Streptomyces sp. NK08204]|nr:hypothetical protein [Streptomyces sp. NK08204]